MRTHNTVVSYQLLVDCFAPHSRISGLSRELAGVLGLSGPATLSASEGYIVDELKMAWRFENPTLTLGKHVATQIGFDLGALEELTLAERKVCAYLENLVADPEYGHVAWLTSLVME